jgi:hypothetical protein
MDDYGYVSHFRFLQQAKVQQAHKQKPTKPKLYLYHWTYDGTTFLDQLPQTSHRAQCVAQEDR